MFFPKVTKIFLCRHPMDMRRSYAGLCGAVREILQHDPLNGALYLFVNKRRDMIKILWREDDGFAIWMKRLDEGGFRVRFSESDVCSDLSLSELSLFLKKTEPSD